MGDTSTRYGFTPRDYIIRRNMHFYSSGDVLSLPTSKVLLHPRDRTIVPHLHRWYNDFTVNRGNSDTLEPSTFDQALRWYESSLISEDAIGFAIHDRATGAPIGVTFLHHIDLRHGTAEYGITIGERSFHGRGYGTEVTQLILDYAFTTLGLHSVMLTVGAFNLAGIRAYEKAGFREIGRRRKCWLMGGRLWDRVYMECVRHTER